jgi:YgiT-type zinc finger domain-containing protein
VNCVLCRNGTLVQGTADKVLSRAGVTLVVQGVPAEICDNCGERYFDEEVTRRLFELARDAVAAGVVVDVRRYVAA